jgi:hypothetical protein
MKRVPIEARQVLLLGPIVEIVLIAAIIIAIACIDNDDPVRGNDVEFLVEHFD